MKYSTLVSIAAFISSSLAATVPDEHYSTLSPSGKIPTGASTDFSGTFGIQVVTVESASALSTDTATSTLTRNDNKDVKATPIAQITDGQIQHQTNAQPIAQISDGQIQHQTVKATPVQQINDGQIQHQTTTAPTTTAASAVKQINDGQIQHQTTSTVDNVAKAQSDGQAIATGSNSNSTANIDDNENSLSSILKACSSKNNLQMTLHNSVLKDTNERWGSIVANHQFQFDGPIPQAGVIYSSGWSIKDGYLYLGDSNIFYQCLSGDFYNLYDENVAKQCSAVKLSVIEFVNC
ncbi:covalently-linked cell wall protein, putative [Candida dubliniensis CD36]|uniref:Protein pir1 homologue, putative n=1 Tax=Candida dubliniensis (strain CD36 / ATCC MYA-646 / CBS 7987 / NCPF 3949 / NRRL Y-17841) TaxID=573826 RepID=B9WCG2_CANDC|nr:covalently-linked cell wall protein, putative [Candida dubliniensis CD36]CAX44084.1 covalently-linked cell wall protein, putative [Candida dubliniensis CD36]